MYLHSLVFIWYIKTINSTEMHAHMYFYKKFLHVYSMIKLKLL